jgi:hypothetical protein
MRRAVALLTVALAAVGTASGTSADRVVTSPGRVLGLARSGYSVAFLSGPYKGHCGPHVELWDLVRGGVYKLGRHTDDVCREGPSTGSGVTDLAVAGNRIFWLAYAGGNDRDWTLYTATTTRPSERTIELATADVNAPSPIVLGVGSEAFVPYAVGSTVKAIAASGRLLFRWQAPGRVTNLTAIGSRYAGQGPGDLAVFVQGGRCFLLSSRGVVKGSFTFPVGAVQEFALAPYGLIVQLPGGRIEIRKGTKVKRLTIPARARMLDFVDRLLLYELGDQIRLRHVVSGKDVLLRRGSFAALEHNGLSYAVGTHVYSIAWATVTSILNGLR